MSIGLGVGYRYLDVVDSMLDTKSGERTVVKLSALAVGDGCQGLRFSLLSEIINHRNVELMPTRLLW